ncbi:DNA-binding transcriptional regulator, MerR family [Fictibacillus solisalsi]|uniref:DNA-binding transcriptional regulator, MerR family n=1 Tax=Fictibacillus solisalsi TaxID=459525 RepID=A0A1G9U1C9_9BACL|nr:MerR family transcriptional regulator [Fictibacillus solisalsi]SDM53827.1 DNA-binding transcriptional regulator, MerR family [Fictibacillus solisalsi]
MRRLKIDEVAQLTGLTKRTIRYYEEIGLFRTPERSHGKIRLYTEEDVEHIKRVMDAKEILGFSLQELQEFLSLKERVTSHKFHYQKASEQKDKEQDLAEMAAGLTEQASMLEEKMKKMLAFHQELTELIQKVDRLSSKMTNEKNLA